MSAQRQNIIWLEDFHENARPVSWEEACVNPSQLEAEPGADFDFFILHALARIFIRSVAVTPLRSG